MAERERRTIDARAVAVGAVTFGAVSLILSGALSGLVYLAAPVVSGLTGAVPIPEYWHVWFFGAVVGAVAGWARLRGARRYGAAVGDDAGSSSRALDAARAEVSRRSAPGVARVVPVQRWSDDLLALGAVLPVKEGLSGGTDRTVARHDPHCVEPPGASAPAAGAGRPPPRSEPVT